MARVDDVSDAATALGLDPVALQPELATGKSISQVATGKGLDVQRAIAADTKAIDDAVPPMFSIVGGHDHNREGAVLG